MAIELLGEKAYSARLDKEAHGWEKVKFGLIGSTSLVFISLLVNVFLNIEGREIWVLVIRDLGIGLLCGFAAYVYPSHRPITIMIAEAILPFLVAAIMVVLR